MKRSILFLLLVAGTSGALEAHNVGTAITWNREISRIFYQRCASCHHEGGTAFSLMKYPEVQPRAVAIKDAVLSRRMPPWGAVKGFGDFRNDQGLTQEELSLITDWVDSDTPKGSNPNVLPKEPKFVKPSPIKVPKNGITVTGDLTLNRAVTVDGLLPEGIPARTPLKIFATLPDGGIEPLVWFYEYTDAYRHPFLFRKPLSLPSGTVIHGVPANASIVLIPSSKTKGTVRKKEFTFRGKIEEVNLGEGTLTVNGEKVEGWMESMSMKYSADKKDVIRKLEVGDQITAKVYDGDYKVLHDIQVLHTAGSGGK